MSADDDVQVLELKTKVEVDKSMKLIDINGKKINFVKVDCDKDSELADKYEVSGYPTIKLDTGSNVIEFKSKPEKPTLVEFLKSSL